ncbi:MAG: hypothetical protein HQL96_05415 [Magnetococcales bacterium]|nr:hypothetical protein [Magnetococcales bacterium]
MSDRNSEQARDASIEAAMQQAIQAEQQAIEAVSQTRRQAETIVLAARHKAAEIAARTESRIAAIRKQHAKAMKKRLDSIRLQQQRQATFLAQSAENAIPLAEAVRILAARLTGAPSDPHAP